MKRQGELYSSIYNWENLLQAFYKAKKRKSHKPDVILYSMNLTENLKLLQKALLQENVPVGNYHYFIINDPKERVICAAFFPERILHHAIMNIGEPYFEKNLIHDTYACRKNKGTDKTIKRAFVYTRQSPWFLKLDIKKYFDTIDHQILLMGLETLFKDSRLLKLLNCIIESYETNKGTGIPIGNLTSQYFANFYLSGLDHLVKDNLGVKRYVRYMDDMCLWGESKKELIRIRNQLSDFLNEKLKLEFKIAVMNTSSNGVPFLGHLIKPQHIDLLGTSKKRRLFRL